MRITILGQYLAVRFCSYLGKAKDGAKYHGFCDPPGKPNREIRLLAGERGKDLLDSVIHESLHAAGWHIREEFVEQFAQDLANVITTPGIWERITDG
jgi:hypothetical protein